MGFALQGRDLPTFQDREGVAKPTGWSMKCSNCNATMAQLFTSVYCPKCDAKDDETDKPIDLSTFTVEWNELEEAFFDGFGYYIRKK